MITIIQKTKNIIIIIIMRRKKATRNKSTGPAGMLHPVLESVLQFLATKGTGETNYGFW